MTIKKNAQGTFDVYKNGVLIEGGFFRRSAAEAFIASESR